MLVAVRDSRSSGRGGGARGFVKIKFGQKEGFQEQKLQYIFLMGLVMSKGVLLLAFPPDADSRSFLKSFHARQSVHHVLDARLLEALYISVLDETNLLCCSDAPHMAFFWPCHNLFDTSAAAVWRARPEIQTRLASFGSKALVVILRQKSPSHVRWKLTGPVR